MSRIIYVRLFVRCQTCEISYLKQPCNFFFILFLVEKTSKKKEIKQRSNVDNNQRFYCCSLNMELYVTFPVHIHHKMLFCKLSITSNKKGAILLTSCEFASDMMEHIL